MPVQMRFDLKLNGYPPMRIPGLIQTFALGSEEASRSGQAQDKSC